MFDLRIAGGIRQCSRLCVRVLRCELKQVRKLKEKNEQHFDILFSRYVCGLDYQQAVKRTGMSSRTYDGKLALAEYFVEGALIGAEIKIFV